MVVKWWKQCVAQLNMCDNLFVEISVLPSSNSRKITFNSKCLKNK